MSDSENIVAKLVERGLPTEKITALLEIISFSLPDRQLIFARQFGRKTVAQILRQIESWKKFLAEDFVLTNPPKAEVEQSIRATELFVWNILMQESFPQVGPWTVKLTNLPTGQYENGSFHFDLPSLRIAAVHRDTNEERQVVIPGEIANNPSQMVEAFKKAFRDLGIYDLLFRGAVGQRLVSMRKPQGWPIFTQKVIPNLYEFLIPYYRTKGHYSEKRDGEIIEPARGAYFPKELLEDMLELLRMAHAPWFAATTVPQLKAVLQRYLRNKEAGIKSHQ